MRRFRQIVALRLFALCWCVLSTGAAGQERASKIAGSGLLPPVLVEFPDGDQLTAKEFLSALRDRAILHPEFFELGEGFLRHQVIVMEAIRKKLPHPSQTAIEARIAEQEASLAPGQTLDGELASAGLTLADLRRMVRESLLMEEITRTHHMLPRDGLVPAQKQENIYDVLWKAYSPAYYGMAARERAATIGGLNFTAEEVLDYIVQWGRDAALTDVFEGLITRHMVMAEARKRRIDTVGHTTEAIILNILEPELGEDKLLAMYKEVREDLRIVRVHHILFAFDRRPGKAYSLAPPTEEARANARLRAQAVFMQLRNRETTFAQAAATNSDCPSASRGGDLGYLADAGAIAQELPFQAYGLDVIRNAQGQEAPITAPPDPIILETARGLDKDVVSKPVLTASGYALVKWVDSRMPTSIKDILPGLKRRRYQQLRSGLLQKQREALAILWQPGNRDESDQTEAVAAAAPGPQPAPPAPRQAPLRDLEPPELEPPELDL